MSQETASVLGNSYRIYSLKYIPYTHSTCRHLVLQGIGKVPLRGRNCPKTSPLFCRKRPNRARVVISWPSRDAVGIFWKPTFYPNHRARNPHPGDGLDPLLGPRIFRALRLGPFEAYRKTSIARGSTSIVHISSEPYNVLISAKNPVVCTQLYRIIQGFHKR